MAGNLTDLGHHDTPKITTELSRELTLFHITMMGVGMMIGAGVFVGTGISIGKSGPGGVLLTFALNGVIALFTGLSYAELSSAIPKAGGAYNFARVGFSKGISFLAGWMEWFASSMAGSLYSVAFATYVLHYFKDIGVVERLGLTGHDYFVHKAMALTVACFFIYINYRGASETGTAGAIMSLGQTLTLAIIAVIGFGYAFGDPVRLKNFTPFLPNGWGKVLITMAFTYVAFEGYEVIVQAGDEAIEPRQNIPKAIIWSLIIVVTTYLGLSFATVVAVKDTGMPAYQWIGQFGATGFAEATKLIVPYGGFLVVIAVIFSATSALNATIYSASRTSFALGRDKMLPPVLAKISERTQVPVYALVTSAVLILTAIITLDQEAITSCADIMFLLLFLTVNLAVIRVRHRYGDELHYGFLMPLFPILPIIAVVCQIALALSVFHMSALAWAISGVWLAASFVIFHSYSKDRCIDTFGKIVSIEEEAIEAHEVETPKHFKIMVPVGNPKNAIQLVNHAIKVARARDGEIHLFNMVAVPDQVPLSDADAYIELSQEAIIEATMYIPEDIPVVSSIRYCRNVARGILTAIRDRGIDLVVLGWRGRSLGRDYILGSTIDPVVEMAPCETAVIKLGKTTEHKSILVPVAGGAHSRAAIKMAAAFALQNDETKIKVFHVLRKGASFDAMQRMLDSIVAEEQLPTDRISINIVMNEDPLEAIVEEANKHGLVIIGASPPSGFQKVLFGTFPEELAARCEPSVIMVRSRSLIERAWAKTVG